MMRGTGTGLASSPDLCSGTFMRFGTLTLAIVAAHVLGSYLFAVVDTWRMARKLQKTFWWVMDAALGPFLRTPWMGWQDIQGIVRDAAYLWLLVGAIAYAFPFALLAWFF